MSSPSATSPTPSADAATSCASSPSPSTSSTATSGARKRRRQSDASVSSSTGSLARTVHVEDHSTSAPTAQATKKGKKGSVIDPERAERLAARAARNRVSAQNSRDRRKQHVGHLETEVIQLRQDKAELTNHVSALDTEVVQLRQDKADLTNRVNALEALVKQLLGNASQADVSHSITQGPPALSVHPSSPQPSPSAQLKPSSHLTLTPPLQRLTDDALIPLSSPSPVPIAAPAASMLPSFSVQQGSSSTSLSDSHVSVAEHARLPAAEATSQVCATSVTSSDAQQRAYLQRQTLIGRAVRTMEAQRNREARLKHQPPTAAALEHPGWRRIARLPVSEVARAQYRGGIWTMQMMSSLTQTSTATESGSHNSSRASLKTEERLRRANTLNQPLTQLLAALRRRSLRIRVLIRRPQQPKKQRRSGCCRVW